mmetsp:Transcript_25473/g.77378  ORF Transcript_25473/g.77378 Transcript_25473/m.77378 type:complete len:304 (-) Transcript_25473:2404-3315(-)
MVVDVFEITIGTPGVLSVPLTVYTTTGSDQAPSHKVLCTRTLQAYAQPERRSFKRAHPLAPSADDLPVHTTRHSSDASGGGATMQDAPKDLAESESQARPEAVDASTTTFDMPPVGWTGLCAAAAISPSSIGAAIPFSLSAGASQGPSSTIATSAVVSGVPFVSGGSQRKVMTDACLSSCVTSVGAPRGLASTSTNEASDQGPAPIALVARALRRSREPAGKKLHSSRATTRVPPAPTSGNATAVTMLTCPHSAPLAETHSRLVRVCASVPCAAEDALWFRLIPHMVEPSRSIRSSCLTIVLP